MNKVAEVSLISQTVTYDDIGVPTTQESETSVIGNFSSVSAQEFFRGGELGIKPEFIVKVWSSEYNGETLLKYNGQRYVIYRMYLEDSGRCELYCQKDVGA